jgi:glycosyltransferase involved in cell wall biosynthesis
MLPALDSGGVERGTLEIGRALVAAGHRSLVISAGGRLTERLVAEGSEHLTWDVGRKRPWTLRWVSRLRRLLEDEQVDILHLRSRMPAWVGYLAWKGLSADSRPRLVTTVHGFYSVNRYSAVMTRGERVIAVSEAVRDYILENYPEVGPARIEVIHRGIDPAQFPRGYVPPAKWMAQWREQYPQLSGKRVLTLPGRLTQLKGHAGFLDLMTTLLREGRLVHGLIVGDAQPGKQRYAKALHDRVVSLGLENEVTLVGHRDDMREIYALSDVVLSLSTQPESYGRTVAEALALGTPVVGYDRGGVGEILRNFYPDGAVMAGDLAGCTDCVRRLLDKAMPAPERPFDWTLDKMLESTLRLYKQCSAVG